VSDTIPSSDARPGETWTSSGRGLRGFRCYMLGGKVLIPTQVAGRNHADPV